MELVLRNNINNHTLTVSEKTFGHIFNETMVHQVVTSYMSSSRQGTRAQKTRSEIVGSNKKPWRQKGTGRARAGSVKSPIWRSGGVTFAAKPKNYKQKINRKVYRGALRSILSELIRQNRLIVVPEFSLNAPKTKLLIQKLQELQLKNNVLIVIDQLDHNLFLASRNLYKVKVCGTLNINPVNLISFKEVIMTINSIKKIEETLE